MTEHERFMDIAGGDPALAKMVQASLKRLEEGAAGEQLQELARDVLSGRSSLREAASIDAYGGALHQHIMQFQQWQEEVGQDEIDRLSAQAEEYAAVLREDLTGENPTQ